jgi:ABC-type sugar transport system ATPase subunit
MRSIGHLASQNTQNANFVLEMNDISKSFFKVKVLDSVTFKVKPGEVHALVGENGAGKSTLMKILMGIYGRDSGEILLDNEKVVFQNPREAIDHGISMIHQELNSVLDLDVAENIFLGREQKSLQAGSLSIVDKKEQIQQTANLFEKMGISINPRSLMRNLSVAQRQLVEIVKAISLSAKIVIMDEPTSAITEKEVKTLFEQIAKLKAETVAIIYISHKIDEIFKVADRISVLRDGKHIGTDETRNFDREKLIKMMVGREIKEFYPKQTIEPGSVALEVKDFSRKKQFRNISFALRSGEILGMAGLVGAGRSELVESIFGVTKPDTGEVFVFGKKVNINHPKDAIRNKMALITEDRKFTGLNLKGSVEHNITIVGLRSLSQFGIVNNLKEAQAADFQIKKLNIKVFSRNNITSSLSGGNQQKVVLSKWLLTGPDIIIMDEPTRGIDVGAKRDIYLLMGELVKAGKAILMISSEIPELMGLSDRILVLSEGKMTGVLEQKEFTQENIMRLASQYGVTHNE